MTVNDTQIEYPITEYVSNDGWKTTKPLDRNTTF